MQTAGHDSLDLPEAAQHDKRRPSLAGDSHHGVRRNGSSTFRMKGMVLGTAHEAAAHGLVCRGSVKHGLQN